VPHRLLPACYHVSPGRNQTRPTGLHARTKSPFKSPLQGRAGRSQITLLDRTPRAGRAHDNDLTGDVGVAWAEVGPNQGARATHLGGELIRLMLGWIPWAASSALYSVQAYCAPGPSDGSAGPGRLRGSGDTLLDTHRALG
jgi:hypothetical protein